MMQVARLLSLRLPWRFLRGSYGRLLLAVVALTSGVALVCAMDLVSRAVLASFSEVVDTAAGRAALSVDADGAPLPEAVVDALSSTPGVELAVPIVSATAFTVDGSGELLTVHGVDVTNETAVRAYEAQDEHGGIAVEDPLVFLSQPDSIALTRTFAARQKLAIGDRLDLATPTGRRRFTVRGLIEPTGIGRAYGGNLVVMDLQAAEAAFLRPGSVSRIDIVVDRGAQLDGVATAIRERLPAGLRVQAPSQRKADLQRVMESLRVMLSAASLLGLAAAALIILNRLTTVFEARSWQLGILRAVGMRAPRLWGELLKESLLLGAAGVLLGVPLGILVGRLLLPVVATTAALNFKLVATQADFHVRPASLGIASLLGLATAILAAAGPAWRLSRRPPIEAIRARGTTLAGRHSAWRMRAVVAAAIVLTIGAQAVTRVPTWGLIATAAIAVGAALAARPVLELVSPWLVGALHKIAGPSAQIARGSLARNNGRAVLTIAMIGVGIGAIVWLRILAYSFEGSLVSALSGALQGDWVVTSAHIANGYLEAPVDQRLVGEVTGIDGVSAAVGERLVDWTFRDGPIAIDAFDPGYFTTTAFGRWPLVGSSLPDLWTRMSQGSTVLISSSLAVNLGVGVGDTLTLDAPNGSFSVPVGGVTVNFSSPRGTIVMSRDLYRSHWGDSHVNRVFVRAANQADPLAVRAAIAAKLGPAYGLRILSARDLVDYFAVQVRRAFAPLDVLAGLLLFVLLLGLADTLAASVLDRAGDLAVIRTLGGRRGLLRRAVIVESLALGIPGLLLAGVVGVGLGMLWVRQTFPFLLGWAIETHVPYFQLALVSVATLVVCWLAGLPPARRAAALDPAAALRLE